MSSHIVIKGARVHNLKNVDVKIPKEKFTVITGLSGSGKSSLAFDTIYAEGQRRYVESLSSYARQFLEMQDKPDVDQIDGLSPTIAIEQRTVSANPRSTVGTVTEIYDYLLPVSGSGLAVWPGLASFLRASILRPAMARPLRIDYPGAFHHVTVRGNRRGDVFLDDADRLRFVAVLAQVCRTYGWSCHAYCLMTNHFHLLVQTLRATLSAGMRQLNGLLTQTHNRRHGTVGHLFQGRFKSVLVESDPHLLEVVRYVVLNSVRAGIVGDPADWPWSNYRSTAGMDPVPDFLDTASTLSMLDPAGSRPAVYRDFVMAGIGQKSPFAAVRNGVLGAVGFVEEALVKSRIECPSVSREVIAPEREPARPTLDRLFAAANGTAARDAVVRRARQDLCYGVTEISDFLGLHYSTVSHIINGRTPRRKT